MDGFAVGVDLAWGPRGRTGVCVVRDGVVVDSSTVGSDAEILATLAPIAQGPCLVGVDAPLVVPNEHGARDCDRAVSRCFRAQAAGAYPANRSLPHLAEPRGGRLADALDLRIDATDPRGDAGRRAALEVYPHAALVGWFGLPRTLPYKYRPARGVPDRIAACTQLIDRLVSLADDDPPLDVTRGPRWDRLTAAVRGARRHRDLNAVEDELDAHVCAYVALAFARHGTDRFHAVGDPRGAHILVPVDEARRRCLERTA